MRMNKREKQLIDEAVKQSGGTGGTGVAHDLGPILARIEKLEKELAAAKAELKELTLGTE